MEHELTKILDEFGEPVTVEELEGVVRRAHERRRAGLIAGAALLLLCGVVTGAVARGNVNDRSGGFAGSTLEGRKPPQHDSVKAEAHSMFGAGGDLTPLFRRDANGVAIRAYRVTWPGQPAPDQPPVCAPPPIIQGELSNAAAVGAAMAPELPGDTFALLGSGVFGQKEAEPATWATVRAGSGVTTVRLTLGGATDSMTPDKGLAVLAVAGHERGGTVEGLDSAGKVVATKKLDEMEQPTIDPACSPPPCVNGQVDPATAPDAKPNEHEVKPNEPGVKPAPDHQVQPTPDHEVKPAPDEVKPAAKLSDGAPSKGTAPVHAETKSHGASAVQAHPVCGPVPMPMPPPPLPDEKGIKPSSEGPASGPFAQDQPMIGPSDAVVEPLKPNSTTVVSTTTSTPPPNTAP